MAQWHRTRSGDAMLRGAGLASCALAYLAIAGLIGLHAHEATSWVAGPADILLAMIGFAAASVGCAMAVLGCHLFDRVPISRRWQPRATSPGLTRLSPHGVILSASEFDAEDEQQETSSSFSINPFSDAPGRPLPPPRENRDGSRPDFQERLSIPTAVGVWRS